MQVSLIAHTPEPEKVVAAAAKLCYSDAHIADLMDGLTPEKTTAFLNKLTDLGHASPTEHASFTFAIEGISRACLAQLTRHRIASFSVQSQRYVRLEDMEVIVPPAIAEDGEAAEMFAQAIKQDVVLYQGLCDVLESKHTEELMIDGVPEKKARARASKMANEDARFVLPNACATKLIMTMNARELNNFFRLRCCNRAQWEIHNLADEILRLVYPVAPTLFAWAGPACFGGLCSEGVMTCGKSHEVYNKYLKLCNKHKECDVHD